jgi:hypothetical protein
MSQLSSMFLFASSILSLSALFVFPGELCSQLARDPHPRIVGLSLRNILPDYIYDIFEDMGLPICLQEG